MPGVHLAGIGFERQPLATSWRAWLGRQHAGGAPPALRSTAAAAAGHRSDADQQPGPPPAAVATLAATTAAHAVGSEVRLRPQEDALAAAALAAGAAAEPNSEQMLTTSWQLPRLQKLRQWLEGMRAEEACCPRRRAAREVRVRRLRSAPARSCSPMRCRTHPPQGPRTQRQPAPATSGCWTGRRRRQLQRRRPLAPPLRAHQTRLQANWEGSVFALPTPHFAAWPWWEGFSCMSSGHEFKVIAQCTQPLSKVYA